MIAITIQGIEGVNALIGTIESQERANAIMRTVATSIKGVMIDRVHTQGLATDGKPIGEYSKGYMVVRTGAYGNADKVSKGKNKGKNKNAGTFTKGQNAFSDVATKKANERPRYNRTADTKVVASLTRALENDYMIEVSNNDVAIVIGQTDNFIKIKHLEETYDKKIFSLTNAEKELAIEIAKNEI